MKKAASLRQGYGRQASGSMPAIAASRRQVALLPNLRAHRLAALCGVRAHVLRVRSARQKGCGLARGRARLGALGLGGSDNGLF